MPVRANKAKAVKAPANMRDVAAEAGVSVTTVSRVLQDNAIPTEETRRRVLEVVKRLNYKPLRRRRDPSRPVQSLHTRHAVAFLTTIDVAADIHGDFDQHEKLVNSLQRWFKAAGYRMYYVRWNTQTEPPPEVLNDPQTRGAVVMGSLPPGVADPLGRRIPLVGLDNGANLNIPGDLALCSVTDCMNASLRYLMKLGHRRIAFFNGLYGYAYSDEHYLETFQTEARRLDLEIDPVVLGLCRSRLISDADYVGEMERYARDLLTAGQHRPTAILLRYRFAIGLVEVIQRMGLSIPDDLSVVGITDRLLHYMHPPMTAYDWPMNELGRSAVELLLSRIADPSRPYRTLAVRGRIIERASCANVAGGPQAEDEKINHVKRVGDRQ